MNVEELVAKIGEDRIRQALESDDENALETLLDQEGVSLTDEQLDSIAGGFMLPRHRRRKVASDTQTQDGEDE